MLVDVRDESGQNLVSGSGVEYEITVFDYGNSDDPSVDVQVTGTDGVSISGDSVQVDGTFSDIDGNTFSIQIDARCASG